MAKFIEVNNGDPVGNILVNLDKVMNIAKTKDGKAAFVMDGQQILKMEDDYESVRCMVAEAQGVLPRRRERKQYEKIQALP